MAEAKVQKTAALWTSLRYKCIKQQINILLSLTRLLILHLNKVLAESIQFLFLEGKTNSILCKFQLQQNFSFTNKYLIPGTNRCTSSFMIICVLTFSGHEERTVNILPHVQFSHAVIQLWPTGITGIDWICDLHKWSWWMFSVPTNHTSFDGNLPFQLRESGGTLLNIYWGIEGYYVGCSLCPSDGGNLQA